MNTSTGASWKACTILESSKFNCSRNSDHYWRTNINVLDPSRPKSEIARRPRPLLARFQATALLTRLLLAVLAGSLLLLLLLLLLIRALLLAGLLVTLILLGSIHVNTSQLLVQT